MFFKKKKLKNPNQKVLYFAYGSNMWTRRIQQRLGVVRVVGVFNLPNHRLTFDVGTNFVSYANVLPEEGSFTQGVVYEITLAQLHLLDTYELLYNREHIDYNGRKLHYYVSRFRTEDFEKPVDPHYYSILVAGCTEHGLNDCLRYLQTITPHVHEPAFMSMYENFGYGERKRKY